MNEQQRMQYLEAMGIDVFVPRWILPAARMSAQAVLPVVEQPLPTEISDRQVSQINDDEPKPSHRIAGVVSGLMDQLIAENTAVPVPSQSLQSRNVDQQPILAGAASASADAPSARFSLAVWPVNAALMVIDSRQPGQALPTSTLLHNILCAKGISRQITRPDMLNWPLFSSDESSDGWPQAREWVQGFLRGRIETRPVNTLWLMGRNAYNAVALDGEDYDQALGKSFDIPQLPALVVVMPSLSDMLMQPSLKALTWAAIKNCDVSD